MSGWWVFFSVHAFVCVEVVEMLAWVQRDKLIRVVRKYGNIDVPFRTFPARNVLSRLDDG